MVTRLVGGSVPMGPIGSTTGDRRKRAEQVVREVRDTKDKAIGGIKRTGGKGKEREDGKGRSEKAGRQPGETAALRNTALFMHCVVGLPGEDPLLDRVRTPGTNWEALNYPPQHREEMR